MPGHQWGVWLWGSPRELRVTFFRKRHLYNYVRYCEVPGCGKVNKFNKVFVRTYQKKWFASDPNV